MQTTVAIQLKKVTSNTIGTCSIPVNETIHYKIYSAAGQLVFSKSIIMINTEGSVMEDLDVSELPEGNYQLIISTEDKSLKNISITV